MNRIKIPDPKFVKKFLVYFHIIAFAGFIIPYTRDLFVKLSPYAFLMIFSLILIYHEYDFRLKNLTIFLVIFLLTFGVELLGLKTGWVFGDLYFGKGLGPKVLGAPVLIGLYWLMLVYCTNHILKLLPIHHNLKPFIAAAVILCYNLLLEQLAAVLDFWHRENDAVPIENYVAWYLLALLMHFIIKKVGVRNPLVNRLFYLQLLFFLALFIGFNLLKL